MPRPVIRAWLWLMEPRRSTLPRLGLRCELMTIAGALWVLFGLGVLTGVSDPPGQLVFAHIPATLRGCVWIGTGAWAFVAGALSRGTAKALAGLMLMPLLRLVSYGLASVLVIIPGEQQGEMSGGWFFSGIYAAMVILVWAMARIPRGVLRDGSLLPRGGGE